MVINASRSLFFLLFSAKSNFQFFLHRSLEQYFDRRQRVNDHLLKLTGKIHQSVSVLTADVLSNLYKTIGVILGILIAALVDRTMIPQIISWASILYLGYLLFILGLLLPFKYLAFSRTVKDYRRNISQLEDILLKEEIAYIEGDSPRRARRDFLLAFSAANLFYAFLSCLAYILVGVV